MFKWLILFAGAYLFYRWLRGKKHIPAGARGSHNPKSNKAQAAIEPEEMVQCRHCKLHLPKSEAKTFQERFYCSEEHVNGLDQQGWIGSAKWCLSPNQDLRPEDVSPDLVVIHHISLPPGEFGRGYVVDFFQNKLDARAHPYFEQIAHQKVSSHFLIDRDGQVIQLVSVHKRAWHAGASQFFERERCNDFSIGIELIGDGESAFTNEQYATLAQLITFLEKNFSNLRFAGHSDIAPDRKTDPGKSFDWVRIQRLADLKTEQLPFGTESR